MEPGSRLFQAVELAGGFTEEAARDYLNMALEVGDGMKITVPSFYQVENNGPGQSPGSAPEKGDGQTQDGAAKGRGGQAGGSAFGSAGGNQAGAGTWEPWIEAPGGRTDEAGTEGASSGKVNLNTATKEELMTLRGIGEARAEDIIRYREEQGGFGAIEEIMNVSGIKEAAFQKIKDSITVQEGAH
jgi:competence protein ComEA